MNKIQLNKNLLFSFLPENAVIAIGELNTESPDVFEISENCVIPENFEYEFFNYEALVENEIVIELKLITE